ncbi:MAG: tetratricopeptide repeat protein [Bacteroidales bacterium]
MQQIMFTRLFHIVLVFLILGFPMVSRAQTYNDYLDRSFSCLEMDDLICAEEALIKALRMEPANINNGILLSNLGTIQRRLKRFPEAIISYSSGLMLMPKSVTLLMNRASLYCEIDSLQDALADYTTAILVDDKNEEAFYLRGLLKLQLADTTGARIDFDHILEFKPSSSRARLGLAALGKYMGRYTDSERLYSMVLSANPNDAEILLNRSEVYLLLNRLSKALEDVNKSIEIEKDNPLAYIMRAKIRLRQYDRRLAMQDLDRARQLGGDPELIDSLAK